MEYASLPKQIESKEVRKRMLFVPQSVLRRTHDYFYPYWQAGVETACFWFGVNSELSQVVTTVSAPKLFQTSGNYMVEMTSMRRLVEEMRAQRVTNLAQIHTHPIDYEAKHSWFDDNRAYSTKDGALSLVWPDYGMQLGFDLSHVGVHERRKGKWCLLDQPDVQRRIQLVDDFADFRWTIDGKGIQDE